MWWVSPHYESSQYSRVLVSWPEHCTTAPKILALFPDILFLVLQPGNLLTTVLGLVTSWMWHCSHCVSKGFGMVVFRHTAAVSSLLGWKLWQESSRRKRTSGGSVQSYTWTCCCMSCRGSLSLTSQWTEKFSLANGHFTKFRQNFVNWVPSFVTWFSYHGRAESLP